MAAKWYNPRTWFETPAVNPFVQNENKLASYNLTYRDVTSVPFNGEKNPGNAGPMINYNPDHYGLQIRSWQMLMESGTAQIGVRRLVTWTISSGLKVQSEPVMSILKDEGINLDKTTYSKSVEDRWNLFRKLKSVDYTGKKNLNQLSEVMEKNSIVGGDLLVVLRVIDGNPKVQLIDGAHVISPNYGTESYPYDLPNGNMIIDGVEMNSKREHVAYWVKTYAMDATIANRYSFTFERVAARGKKTGLLMAYLYTGDEFRIDNVRGMPSMSPYLEKLTNLDLYSAATLKQAQESAKVDYQVVHDKAASGEAPWGTNTVRSLNGGNAMDNSDMPQTDDGVQKMKTTRVTGIGTAINNKPGSKLEMLENKNPLYFKDFNETHRDEFFAGIQLPPNVAMSKYNDSFSASRAAVMDWAHTLLVRREHLKVDGLKPIFDLWLHLQILQNKIQAPGYITAYYDRNELVLEAYRNIRMVGANVPHIDPVKEVTAARLKLGAAGASLPLGDGERVTEDLGMGDFYENMEQFGKDLEKSLKLKIRPEPVLQQVTGPQPSKKKKPVRD